MQTNRAVASGGKRTAAGFFERPDGTAASDRVGEIWEGGGRRYRMEKAVGNGAFGIVWRARSEEGETVAIKKVMLDRRYKRPLLAVDLAVFFSVILFSIFVMEKM